MNVHKFVFGVFAVGTSVIVFCAIQSVRLEGDYAREWCGSQWEDSGMEWRVKKINRTYYCQIKTSQGWIPSRAYRGQ